jgi:hypothetical protein
MKTDDGIQLTSFTEMRKYNDKYGDTQEWRDALAKEYRPIMMSADKRYILYHSNINAQCVIDTNNEIIYLTYGGQRATVNFASLTGIDVDIVNSAIELNRIGTNDPNYWRDTYVKAVWLGESFSNHKNGEEHIIKTGDTIYCYVRETNEAVFMSTICDLRYIKCEALVSKDTVHEWNKVQGYLWDRRYKFFMSQKQVEERTKIWGE